MVGHKVIGENMIEREREGEREGVRRVGYFIFFLLQRVILGCVHLSGYKG